MLCWLVSSVAPQLPAWGCTDQGGDGARGGGVRLRPSPWGCTDQGGDGARGGRVRLRPSPYNSISTLLAEEEGGVRTVTGYSHAADMLLSPLDKVGWLLTL